MENPLAITGRTLLSTILEDGTLTLSLDTVTLDPPGDDEVIVRIEAAPINPSDLGLMLAAADVETMRVTGYGDQATVSFQLPVNRLQAMKTRLGQAMPVGNEGAGTVVACGPNAAHLEGKRVGAIGGGMYADYRKLAARDVVELPEGASARDGAAMFVNPLTSLSFVETMRSEGHSAIVHTAAASNLGQMLQKICLADGIPLVNIVRSEQQAQILRDIGAVHVLNSRDEDFDEKLTDALYETGATIAFDAIGGGDLGDRILRAMERAAVRDATSYSTYGSDTLKQLYIYGMLDNAPTVLNRAALGFQFSMAGWLLTPFLRKAGPEVAGRLRQRILAELTTTFASNYTQVIGLAEALQPDVLRAYDRKATGEKYLIDPTKG
jgi:NADPH:quinone reductase-like Zn-dependent oxidoreductase